MEKTKDRLPHLFIRQSELDALGDVARGADWEAGVHFLHITLMALGAVAVGASLLLANQLPAAMTGRDLARTAVIALVSVPAYAVMLRAAAPATWNELIERVKGIIRPTRS